MPTIEEQLNGIIDEYEKELAEQTTDTFKEVGKDTSKLLKNTSPKGNSSKHYASGWTYKVRGKGVESELTIYNKAKPGLTHLLENGHQVYRGKKNYGRTKPIKHIEPAEKKALNEIMTRLTE